MQENHRLLTDFSLFLFWLIKLLSFILEEKNLLIVLATLLRSKNNVKLFLFAIFLN